VIIIEKNIKYCQVTNYRHQTLIDGEFYTRSGLYQWCPTFGGAVYLFNEVKDNLENFDIIQVNLSAQDFHLVNNIKERLKSSSTKIVANCDYTTELWQSSFDYIDTMKRELSGADMVFGTEPMMAGALQTLINRKVHIMPHPTDVKRLKTLSCPDKDDYISVNWHRYDNFSMIPAITVRDLGKKLQLIGYNISADKKRYVTGYLYDRIVAGTNFLDFTDILMKSPIVFEPFTLNSYGRTTTETAALGVPTVGSNRVESVRRCFPKTCLDPYDVIGNRKMVKRVLTDEKFKNEVIEYAKEACEFYNKENSRNRYLTALNEGSKKI
jgi:hypothetical protein